MSQTQPSPAGPADDDWAVQAADTVERVVRTVHDRTVKPAQTVAKAIVYGIVAAVAGITALTLLSVALVRVINVYLPGDVWAAHLIVGAVFVLGGLVLWTRRRAPAPRAT